MMRAVAILVVAACSSSSSSVAPNDQAAGSWRTPTIGSAYVTQTLTRMETPFPHETITTTKQTLVARTDTDASVRLEITDAGKISTQEVRVPLRVVVGPAHDGSTVTTARETCTVPAGTYECTRSTVEVHDGPRTRSHTTWTAKHVPIPIKSILVNDGMTITTELTAVMRETAAAR